MFLNAIIKLCVMLWVALAALLNASQSRAAEPFLISQAYWVDEGGTATLDDVRKADFTPFEGSLAKGYKPFALWVKLRIGGKDGTEPLALVVQPAFLRQIELFDPAMINSGQPVIPLVSGRDANITPANHIGFNNGFVIPSSREPRDLYLRVTTTTTLAVDIAVKPLAEAEFDGQVTASTLSVYLAFLSAFLLWALVNWAVRRDLLYGLFALRLLFSILHLSVMTGILRYFLSGELNASARDNIYNFVLVSIIAVTATFDFKLISEFGVPRWLRKVAWSLLALPAACLVLLLMGHVQMALHVNALVVIVVVVMNVVLAFSVRNRDVEPYGQLAISTIRIGYVLMALVIIAPALISTSVFHTGVPAIKVVFLHALITTVILFAVLSIRARQKDLLAQQSLMQYEIKERELRQESERRAEKERFLSMLVHELRNPLAVIHLRTGDRSSSSKAVHQAALDMAQIIERVEQSETLDHASVHVQRTKVDLGEVLRELTAEHPAASRVDVEVAAGLTVETDEDMVRRIVKNLLDNAWKYSPDSSRIGVALAERSADGVDGVQLKVFNEVGEVGVPDAEKLFTKYYRSKGAHRRSGSGLGLFLVSAWVKALGGTIGYEEITSAHGSPLARFSLWLPK